nr:MAG TPA: hypothetical protein [Caudoviricetes sp.]
MEVIKIVPYIASVACLIWAYIKIGREAKHKAKVNIEVTCLNCNTAMIEKKIAKINELSKKYGVECTLNIKE